MGNYIFKLSDMVPSAWFYMRKSRSRSRSHIKRKQTSSSSLLLSSSSNLQQHQRKSYYFSKHLSPNSHQSNETLSKHPISNNISINFSEPPRKSSKKRRRTSRGKHKFLLNMSISLFPLNKNPLFILQKRLMQ